MPMPSTWIPFATDAGRRVAAEHPGPGDTRARWQAAVLAAASSPGHEGARALGVSLRTLRRWIEWLRERGIGVETRAPGRVKRDTSEIVTGCRDS